MFGFPGFPAGVKVPRYLSPGTYIAGNSLFGVHAQVSFFVFFVFWPVYSAPDLDLAVSNPNPAVSERLPSKILLPRLQDCPKKLTK